jgi:putative cell wall-binding protein
VVADELTRLAPPRIFVVGGPAAVSVEVEAQLDAWAPVERVAGPDRYATAAEVSRRFFPAGLSPDYPAVMVASGEGFPDALSASSVSAAVPQNPVLLTRRDQLPAATSSELARLRPASVLVVGGAAAVSESVTGALATLGSVRRYAGPDRYATAAEVATGLWSDAPLLFVASGETYADALVAGAAGRPLLLVPQEGIPSTVSDALFALRPTQVEVVGGTAAVSDATAAELGALVAALAA